MDIPTANETPLATDTPQLTVVRMQPATIRGLKHATSMRWQEALLAAGMLAEVDSLDPDDPDDPRAWLQAVQTLLLELTMLEDERDSLRSLDLRPGPRDAPWWMWVLLLFQPWLAVQIGKHQASDLDRFMTLFWVYVIPAMCAAGIGIGLAVIIRRRRKARKTRLRELSDQLTQAHLDLADGAGRTLARDFAMRSGHRLLVNTPSLDLDDADRVATVDARIAELQRDPPATWVRLDI